MEVQLMLVLSLPLVVAGALAAPHHGSSRRVVQPGHDVTVIATDYKLSLPSTLTAGPTTFRLVNRGRELHQLYLVKLANGKKAADYVHALKPGTPPPSWATDVGGPNGVDPGATSLAATVPLTPGHYAALCIIPGPDGVPHIMKGMYTDLDVTTGARAASLPAKPDLTISLVDYGYGTSSPLTAGSHHIVVRNDGKQWHELEIARLMPGKTPADLASWAEKMSGPPPATFLGGVSPISPGKENELAITLTPGHYVMLCFLPDARDGKPHTAHGMVKDFVIH
jgi:uncharacterized cupredoxin-like copper-binding protein